MNIFGKQNAKKLPPEARNDQPDDLAGKPGYTETASTIMAVLKTVLYICFIIIVSGVLAYFAISFANDVYAFVKDSEEVEVEIPEYADAADISKILAEDGVIKYPWLFRLYAKLKHVDRNIADNPEKYAFVAGVHTVNGMMNYDELLISLRPKSTRTTKRLTIPEGYNVEDIITLFVSNGIGTREGFIEAINNAEYDYDFVAAIDMSDGRRAYRLEGYLYPDTYDFYTDNDEEYYIKKLLARFDEVYSKQLREYTEESGFTVDEIVTIASIIEKEAYYASDFDQGIGCNTQPPQKARRLPSARMRRDDGIRMARSPKAKSLADLTAEQLNFDSPYNTYVAKGLPPGAICNPSYQALTCAISPDSESSNYFFVTDTNRFMLYAETRAGHERNVALVKQHREQEAAGH